LLVREGLFKNEKDALKCLAATGEMSKPGLKVSRHESPGDLRCPFKEVFVKDVLDKMKWII